MNDNTDYIELGKVAGFFGVKGWVKLFSYSRPRISIQRYQRFYLGETKNAVTFTQIKKSGKHIIGHIDGVDSREAANFLQEQILYVKYEDLPKLDNGYYWHELIGLTVTNQQGVVLGNISEMMETGANDVMVIHNNDTQEEILIPYVMSHFVLSVDLTAGTMQVDWEADNESA